jgi:ABC-2 type transport system ATP-binding protein
MLHAIEVSFAYRNGGPSVVDGVSLAIERGDLVGLLGPNGSGKTTILKLLGGMLRPRHGSIAFEGRKLADWPRREAARKIAYVPQETHAPFDFSVMEIVLMGRFPHLGPFALEGPADLAVAHQALEATGMSAFASRPFHTLSGGEKQRVVIASALAQEPELLLLDEPTASLDPDTADWIRSRLERYRAEQGATVLLASHNMGEVERLCERVIIMKTGHIEDDDTPAHLLARYGRETLEEVFLDVARGRRHREAAQ